MNKLVLHLFNQQSEHAEADCKQASFNHCSIEKDFVGVEYLKNVENSIGNRDYKQIAKNGYSYHNLVSDHISEIVANGLNIAEEGEHVPSICEASIVQTSRHHYILSTISEFFKIVVESKDVNAHLL